MLIGLLSIVLGRSTTCLGLTDVASPTELFCLPSELGLLLLAAKLLKVTSQFNAL